MKKKLFLILFMSITTIGLYAQEKTSKADQNKWSVDFGVGLNRPYSNFNPGYRPASLGFGSGTFGVRYMLNEYFGLRAGLGYDSFDEKDNSKPFDSNQYNFDLQGVINIGRVMHFQDWTNMFTLLAHGGYGIGIGEYGDKDNQWVNYPIAGITAEIKVAKRVALFADASAQMNLNQNYGFDGSVANADNIGDIFRGTIGVSISLGKSNKHADFSYCDKNDALSILKNRLNTLENKVHDNTDAIIRNNQAIEELQFNDHKPNMEMRPRQNSTDEDISTELINNGFMNIYYQTDKTNVEFSYIKNIVFIKNYMEKNPDAKLTIMGYADELGTSKYNEILSQNRANVVAKLLEDYGIDSSKIQAKGKGKLPITTSNYASEMARKVSFSITK